MGLCSWLHRPSLLHHLGRGHLRQGNQRPLQWRQNGRDCVSNHRRLDCLLSHSASLAFVRGIYRWPVNSPQNVPVTRKMFPFDDVIMQSSNNSFIYYLGKMVNCRMRNVEWGGTQLSHSGPINMPVAGEMLAHHPFRGYQQRHNGGESDTDTKYVVHLSRI